MDDPYSDLAAELVLQVPDCILIPEDGVGHLLLLPPAATAAQLAHGVALPVTGGAHVTVVVRANTCKYYHHQLKK